MLAILEVINAIAELKDIDKRDLSDIVSNVVNYDNSIATYARQNICQFPLLCSTNLSVDGAIKAAQILEQQYTTYIKMVITNNTDVVNLTKGENKGKLLRKIHQNDYANYGLADKAAYSNTFSDLMNNESGLPISFSDKIKYNRTTYAQANKELLTPYASNFNLGNLNNGLLKEASDDYEDEVSHECSQFEVNLQDQRNDLNTILEQLDKEIDGATSVAAINNILSKNGCQTINSRSYDNYLRSRNLSRPGYNGQHSAYFDTHLDEAKRQAKINIRSSEWYSQRVTAINKTAEVLSRLRQNNAMSVHGIKSSVTSVRTDSTIRKNNELEPSVLDMDIMYENNNTMKSTRISVGVKTIIHLIDGAEMNHYLTKSLAENKPFFRLIQWTTGEIKFLKDFILDLNRTKDEATSDKKSMRWWRHLKCRKVSSKIRAVTGRDPFLPNATVVLSKEDIEIMKMVGRIDIFKNTRDAARLMDLFFLLHIVIIDESDDMIYLFNKDSKVWERYKFNKLQQDIASSLKQANNIINVLK